MLDLDIAEKSSMSLMRGVEGATAPKDCTEEQQKVDGWLIVLSFLT